MIVTISRQLGSGGDEIAARVAAALGLTLVDRDRIHAAARSAGIPDELLAKLMYEGQRSLAGDILDSLENTSSSVAGRTAPVQSPLGGIFAPMMLPTSLSLGDVVQVIGLVIKDIASRDRALILGQGGQVWLRGYRGACHVQIVAPLKTRIERVSARDGVSQSVARKVVRTSDQARSEYLARYHGANWLDPLLYHVVINTGQTTPEAAVSLIAHAAQVVG